MSDTSNDGTPPQGPRSIEEMKAWLREFQKAERMRRIARGRAKPRTRRETEIFLEGMRRRLGKPGELGDGV